MKKTAIAAARCETGEFRAPTASHAGALDLDGANAFELLQLGDSIVRLQTGLRELRLEKEDLRFERDRYRASAARYQQKLTEALDALDADRAATQDAARLRRDIADLAVEFERHLAAEREAHRVATARYRHDVADMADAFDRRTHEDRERAGEAIETARREQRGCEQAARDADRRLRETIASLAHEFEERLGAMEPPRATEARLARRAWSWWRRTRRGEAEAR